MRLFIRTDVGLVRKSNQDAVDGGEIFDGNLMWIVLCDGMGGHNGGNVASDIATSIARENVVSYDINGDDSQSESFLRNIIDKANNSVYHKQKRDISLSGMGTTMEFIIAHNNKVRIAHVGDSRVYCIKNGKIEQLTTDHSVVQEMVNRGELTPEQAMVHPNKNFITRAVGVRSSVKSDYIEIPFEKDDILITCSDGLSNYIPIESIQGFAQLYYGDELTEKLIDYAKQLGGGDNISVAVMYANNIRE